MNIFFGWNTTKVEGGFEYEVRKNVSRTTPNSNGSYCDYEVVKTGVCSSRAIATARAKAWKMHFTAQLRQAA